MYKILIYSKLIKYASLSTLAINAKVTAKVDAKVTAKVSKKALKKAQNMTFITN